MFKDVGFALNIPPFFGFTPPETERSQARLTGAPELAKLKASCDVSHRFAGFPFLEENRRITMRDRALVPVANHNAIDPTATAGVLNYGHNPSLVLSPCPSREWQTPRLRLHVWSRLITAIRYLCVIALLFGCSGQSQLDNTANTSWPKDSPTMPTRFPDASDGEWISVPELDNTMVQLKDEQFHPMEEPFEVGYVPIEASAPTIKATVVNKTDRHIARIRIRVKAVAKADKQLLAEEVTDVPGEYYLIEPNSSQKRIVALSWNGPFVTAESWPNFAVVVEMEAAQFLTATDTSK